MRLILLLIFIFNIYGRVIYLPVDKFRGFVEEPRLELLIDLQGRWDGDYYVPFYDNSSEYVRISKNFTLDVYSVQYLFLYIPILLGECEIYLNGWKLYITDENINYVLIPVDKKYFAKYNLLELRFRKVAPALRNFYNDLGVGVASGVYILNSCVPYDSLSGFCRIRVFGDRDGVSRAKVYLPYDKYYGFGFRELGYIKSLSNVYIGGKLFMYDNVLSYEDLLNSEEVCVIKSGNSIYYKDGKCYKSFNFSGVEVPVEENIHLSFWVIFLFSLVLLKRGHLSNGLVVYISRLGGIAYILYFIINYVNVLRDYYWDVDLPIFSSEVWIIVSSIIVYDLLRMVFSFLYSGLELVVYHWRSDVVLLLGSAILSVLWINGFRSYFIMYLVLFLVIMKLLYLGYMLLRFFNISRYSVILYICTSEILVIKLLYFIGDRVLW